jgi:Na+-transporting methylmalonyl-CoA/oxaloacetate decarboxylase gamma subunit
MTLDWWGFALVNFLIFAAYQVGKLEQQMSDEERAEARAARRRKYQYQLNNEGKQ